MTPDKTMIQAAIAGCGTIAPIHADALAAMPGVELVALADPDENAMHRLAAMHRKARPQDPVPSFHPDLESLLEAQKPDIVHLCTPHHTHVELARQALEAGARVLMEKPPGTCMEDLGQLQALERDHGPKVTICYQNRFNEASLKAFLLLRSGLAGDLVAARAFVTWKRDKAYYRQASWRGTWASEGGGVMINQAIHTLDLLIWLAGRPRTVQGSCHQFSLAGEIEVEDTAQAHLALPGGATGLFYATNAYGTDAPTFLEVQGQHLLLRLEGDRLAVHADSQTALPEQEVTSLLTKAEKTLQAKKLAATDAAWLKAYQARQKQRLSRSVVVPGKEYWGQSHARLIEAYYENFSAAQDEPFPLDIDQASQALKVLLALYEADRERKPVDL